MPHSKLEDLPAGGGGRWPMSGEMFRSEQWGDMEIGLTDIPMASDSTAAGVAGGLAGGVCPCPHYGYIFSGTIRATYPGSPEPDEVATAGEAYFFPAGHVLIYEEATKALELNPAYALKQCMDAINRGIQALYASGETPGEPPST